MFFKTLSTTNYSAPGIGINRIPCIDIFKRVNINFDEGGGNRSYDYYDMMPGDTPDIISTKSYNGNPYWYWAILMYNNITNPFRDFYRDPDTAIQNAESRYNRMGSFFYDDEAVVFSSFTKTRDLRAGDIIIKINSDGTLPDPYSTTTVSVQLVEVNKSKREMRFIVSDESGTFAEGDAFAVIDKNGGTYTVAYKSKILKRYDKVTKGISSFKDNEGKTIPERTKSPTKLFASYQEYLTAKLNDSILGEFNNASGSGNWSNTVNEGYRALSIEDQVVEDNTENFGRIKIPDARILQPLLTEMQVVLNRPPTRNKKITKGS